MSSMSSPQTEPTLLSGIGEQLEDEFDIDLKVIGVETTGWFGDPPPWSDVGSTCELSCQDSCGGTCTCPGVCFAG